MSDWYLSPRPQRTLETLRLFYRATAQFLVWVWSRTELGSRPRAWRFSVAECQQRRPACPWRARWRSAASKEGQRRVLQRPPCIMTTDCHLQTVPSSTTTTTLGRIRTLHRIGVCELQSCFEVPAPTADTSFVIHLSFNITTTKVTSNSTQCHT